MDLHEQFSRAWKEKFPSCSQPNIECLSHVSENSTGDTHGVIDINKMYEHAKQETEQIRVKLQHAEFVEDFLKHYLSSSVENKIENESKKSEHLEVPTDEYSLHDGLKKTVSVPTACLKVVTGDSDLGNFTRKGSAPPRVHKSVGPNFNCTWMTRITGSADNTLDDSSDDSSEEENVHENLKTQQNDIISDLEGNSIKVLGSSGIDSDKNCGVPDKQITHDSESSNRLSSKVENNCELESEDDSTKTSVQSRILSLERIESQKRTGIHRKNSDKPHVPLRPGKPRLSKPTRHLPNLPDSLERDPEGAEKLCKLSAGEPTTAISHQNKGNRNQVDQDLYVNDSCDNLPTYAGPVNNSCEEEDISTAGTHGVDLVNSQGNNVDTPDVGRDSTHHITVIEVSGDSESDDMKRLRGKSYSTGDQEQIQATGFKLIGENRNSDPQILERYSKISSDKQEKTDKPPELVPKQQGIMSQIRERQSRTSSSSSTGKSPGNKKCRSNYMNVSINVLLTQDEKIKVSDDSSSEEEDNEIDNTKLNPRHNIDESSPVGSLDSRCDEASTSSAEMQDGSSDRLSPHGHRKKLSTISTTSFERDSVFVPSDDDHVTKDLHDGKDEGRSDEDNISCGSLDELSKKKPSDPERQRKLEMRKILLEGILKSEQSYVADLQELIKLKRKLQLDFQTLCSMEDITTIFYKVEDICQQHEVFVENLQDKMNNWTDEQEVGKIFKELIVFLPMYLEYVENTTKAKECVIKCCNADSDFRRMACNMKTSSPQSDEKEVTTLEEILFKPVQRLQRNTLVLHDLLKVTPEDHVDVKNFNQALHLVELKLKNFGADQDVNQNAEDQHHLVKSGFMVEMVGNSRKLRYIFLFGDTIVCTKHKISGRHKVKSFEVKWFLPVCELSLQICEMTYQCNEDIETLKKKIVSLKAELRAELRKNDSKEGKPWIIANRGQRTIEKLKKKIEEQEASLVLSSPHLAIQLVTCKSNDESSFTLLLSNDFEREEWREAICNQQKQHYRVSSHSYQRQLSIHDIQTMINDSKQLPQVNKIGTVLMRKDDEMLNGSLNVTIHALTGLDECCDTYCQLELDSYGHFFMKAKSGLSKQSKQPFWNEDFELDLDGSQTLRILCYKKLETNDQLIGKSALELSTSWLRNSFQEKEIPMNDIALTISVRHTPASKTLKRSPSKMQGGMFGVKLANITKREGKTVPTIVSTCVKEIESRGIHEIGIYRVSGVTSEIQRLKKTFDKNLTAAKNMITNCDINAVTGLLKLYFRELPEPIFTDENYKAFVTTVGLSDADLKQKCMLQLLHNLPDENYYTIVMMINHLVKIGGSDSENKMTFSNLATVFGPTLLHPATKDSKPTQADIMQSAQEVFLQADVVSFFINLVASGKSIHRSANTT